MVLTELLDKDQKVEHETFLQDEITTDGLVDRYKHQKENERFHVWTPAEVYLAQEFIPTVAHRLQGSESEILRLSPTLDRILRQRERAALITQFQSELAVAYFTLDAAILHMRRDVGTVAGKLRKHHRLANIAKRLSPEAIIEPDRLVEYVDADDAEHLDLSNALIRIKESYTNAVRNLPEYNIHVDEVMREASGERPPHYVDVLRKTMRGDLVAVVLHGSATRETNRTKVSDYDNIVVIRDGRLFEAYEKLKGLRQVVGRIEGKKGSATFTVPYQWIAEDGKPVQLNLVEEGVFKRLMRWQSDVREYVEQSCLLYGSVTFPNIGNEEAREREVTHILLRANMLKGACAWVSARPEDFVNKPQLMDYYGKTPRFMLKGINVDGLKQKGEIDCLLKQEGIRISQFRPGPQHVKTMIYDAMAGASMVIGKYLWAEGLKGKFVVPASETPFSSERSGMQILRMS